MGGKTGTTTSSVGIPKDILNRYTAVNKLAEQTAKTPFKPYTGEFVAPLTETQQAGISQTEQAAQEAQPYYGAATQQLLQAQQAAAPQIGAAGQTLAAAQQAGRGYADVASQLYGQAGMAASPYYQAATGAYQTGLGQAMQAAGMAQPYYSSATQQLLGAQANLQPQLAAATEVLGGAGTAGQQYANLAQQLYGGAGAAAQPYYQAATTGTQAALGAAQPYQALATGLGLSGARGIQPGALDVGAYMSPYLTAAAEPTRQALMQQQQAEMSGQLGNIIKAGAFGGDRAGIVAANLARQQQLGMAQAMAPIYQQAYQTALATAQQQQGLGLSAEQANRAAQAAAAQQMAALGQQGYGQQLGAAQQMAGLGQALYGQGLGTGQALAGLGQQQYAQQAGVAQQLAALAQQQYGAGAGTAQQLAALGTGAQQAQLAGAQGVMGAGQGLAGLGQQLYGQALGTGQAIAGLGAQQFGQGATAAQQQAALAQQLYGMGAGTSQQLAALGAGAQQAGLQGAQATIGAGTLEQQTKQAQDTAQYQQFLQERGYPFQVAQFLANIAMGTGALSGSTTTTTQPIPFFSDRRLKDDVKEIGKTNDGMPIYSFKYKGDDATQIGLMAQDVEKKHPEAVGLAGGYKTVDYGKATEDSARPEKAEGGLVPSSMGGSVYEPGHFADGGLAIDPNDLQAILQSQKQSFGPFSQSGLYGQGTSGQGGIGGAKSYVPPAALPTPRLLTASAPASAPDSVFSQIASAADKASGLTEKFTGKSLYERAGEKMGLRDPSTGPEIGADKKTSGYNFPDKETELFYLNRRLKQLGQYRGGVAGYAEGGTIIDPYEEYKTGEGVPKSVMEKGDLAARRLEKPDRPDPITRGPGNDIMDFAKIAMMFMKDGGSVNRHGYATYGAVDEYDLPKSYGSEKYDPSEDPFYGGGLKPAPELPAPIEIKERSTEGVKPAKVSIPDKEDSLSRLHTKVLQAESNSQQFDENGRPLLSKKGAVGIGQILPSTGPEAAKLAGLDWDESRLYNDKEYNSSLSKAYLNSMYSKFGSPQLAAAAYNAGPGAVEMAQKKADAEGGNVLSYLPNETQNYVAKIFGEAKGLKPTRVAQADTSTKSDAGLGAGIGLSPPNTVEGSPRSWSDYFNSKDFIIPFLSGLKGMAQSRSPFLGSALLEGLGAGAESYMGLQKQEADIGQTVAQTRGIETGTYQKSLMQTPFGNFMWLADGSLMPLPDYNDLAAQGKAPPLLGRVPENGQQAALSYTKQHGVGTQTPSATMQTVKEQGSAPTLPGVGFDKSSIDLAKNQQRAVTMGGPGAENAIARSTTYNNSTNLSANAARDAEKFISELAQNLHSTYRNKGLNTIGFGADFRSQMVSALNTSSSAFGGPSFGTLDSDAMINDKLTSLLGAAQAKGAGNETLGALQMMRNVIGGVKMPAQASSKVTADLWTQNQRAIDRDSHRSAFGKYSNEIYADTSSDFERTNPQTKYKTESEVLQKLIMGSAQPKMINGKPNPMHNLYDRIQSGEFTPEQVDQILGVDGIHRYFTGGR